MMFDMGQLFTDPDGHELVVEMVTAIPTWMQMQRIGSTIMIFGTPDGVHTLHLLYLRATDPFGETVTSTAPVEIEEFDNQAPIVNPIYAPNSGGPAFATPLEGLGTHDVFGLSNFQVEIPDDTFSDPDGDVLYYSLRSIVAEGEPPVATVPGNAPNPEYDIDVLFDWCTFTPESRTIVGIAPKVNVATYYHILVLAFDWKQKSAWTYITLRIIPNRAPVITNSTDSAVVREVYEQQFLVWEVADNMFTDPDNDRMTYTMEMADLEDIWPAWAAFDTNNKTLTGLAPPGKGTYYFRVWAADNFGKTDVKMTLKVVPIDEEQMFFYAFLGGGAIITFTAVLMVHSMCTSTSGHTEYNKAPTNEV